MLRRIVRFLRRPLLACIAAGLPLGPLAAQAPAGPPIPSGFFPTPDALVNGVLDRFAARDTAAFAGVFPHADARQLMGYALQGGWPLHAAGGGVVRASGDSGVVWLAGWPETGHSGYETSLAQMFTGLYRVVRSPEGWRLGERLPLDDGNRILAHTVHGTLRPGRGFALRDSIRLVVGNPDGAWLLLNRVARVDSVLVNGRPAEWRHTAGLFWIPRPGTDSTSLVLVYDLDIGRDSAKNGYFARFDSGFGHVRNQHYWLPFFGFASERGLADFAVTLDAPAGLPVVLDIPTTDSVAAGVRRLHARSARPTSAITLFYDRDWKPLVRRLGALELHLMATDSIEPSRDSIVDAVARVQRVLSAEFGEPTSPWLTIAQGRGVRGNGWIFKSNDLLASAPRGGSFWRAGPRPAAGFAHEVAHGWTSPTGPGSTFLSEGWAVFAESLVLADVYGDSTARQFWEIQRAGYLTGGYEGEATLATDAHNGGVSYEKGAWLLRMLRDYLGPDAFARGMRSYMSIPQGEPAGVAEFTAAMTVAAGRDLWPFIQPWHEHHTIPTLDAALEPGRLIVTQRGPIHLLPLEFELETPGGPIRRSLLLDGPADTLALDDLRPTAVRLDPDRRLLLHRPLRTVRVTLSAPGAESVLIGGSFAAERVPAEPAGDRWQAELTLEEGSYSYAWWVDGEMRDGGILTVE